MSLFLVSILLQIHLSVPSNPYIAVFAPSKKSLQRFLLISLKQTQTLEADSFAFSNCSFEVLSDI
jgi:hypothetical protein